MIWYIVYPIVVSFVSCDSLCLINLQSLDDWVHIPLLYLLSHGPIFVLEDVNIFLSFFLSFFIVINGPYDRNQCYSDHRIETNLVAFNTLALSTLMVCLVCCVLSDLHHAKDDREVVNYWISPLQSMHNVCRYDRLISYSSPLISAASKSLTTTFAEVSSFFLLFVNLCREIEFKCQAERRNPRQRQERNPGIREFRKCFTNSPTITWSDHLRLE
jgi:hypothetical protein